VPTRHYTHFGRRSAAGSGVFGEGVLARQDHFSRIPLGARFEPAEVRARGGRPALGVQSVPDEAVAPRFEGAIGERGDAAAGRG
jgi:hypothetical protein